MNDENYIHVDGWMINRLGLKGNELLTYAIIYGFSQDGETWFKGSIKYIADSLQVSRPTAIKVLDSLTKKGLIVKNQENINDVIFNRYKTNLQVVKNVYGGSKESLLGGSKESLLGGSKESLPSNTNKELNIKNDIEKQKAVYFPLDETLDGAFRDFLDMRKKIKKPMTDRAIELAISKLEKLSEDAFGTVDNDKAVEIINQSIEHGWQTFYPLKEEKQQKKSGGYDWDNL